MNGRTVVVTGASGGIGISTVRMLLDKQYHVIGLDKSSKAEKNFRGEPYFHFNVDISREQEVQAACREISARRCEMEEFKSPDYAVLIAGGALPEEIKCDPLNIEMAIFRGSIDLNLSAQYICIKHLVPLLRSDSTSGRDSSITLTSSINSMGDFGYPAYSAAKAGLTGLTKSLARPLGRHMIRINAVAFGTVITENDEKLHIDDPTHFDRLRHLTALGKLLTVEQAARILVEIMELSGMSGTVIPADYGQVIPGNHPSFVEDC
jgi:NAD(P)-dependent dehydrogenase (short-subunit alcohol dehydrogenase family)